MLLFPVIDIARSKRTGKLCYYKKWYERFLDILEELIIVSILPVFTGMFLLSKIRGGAFPIISILLFFVALGVSGILFRVYNGINKLTRVKCVSQKNNSDIIESIAKKHGWKAYKNNQQIAVMYLPWRMASFHWGQQVVVIHDNPDILVNCITFSRFNTASPFHQLCSNNTTRHFIDELKNVIKSRSS